MAGLTFVRWAITSLLLLCLFHALCLFHLASHVVELHDRVAVLEFEVSELLWASVTRNYVRDARWTDRFSALNAKVNWYIIQRSGVAELNRADAFLEEDP